MNRILPLLKKHQKKEQCISHKTIKKIAKQTGTPVKHMYHKICHHHEPHVNHYHEVLKHLIKKDKHIIIQTAPSSKVSIGEEFGLKPGTIVTGKLVAALKKCGFDKVFDTSFGADICIMEESAELIKRLKQGGPFPLITTCCPAWIRFMEHFYHRLIPNMSTCKSPHEMLGVLSKEYYAKKTKIPKSKIIVVSLMPCVAKRFESERPELKSGVDYVLTTKEASELIKQFKIDFKNIKPEPYDDTLGDCSGAGAIFAGSGGVMEAALRTTYELYTRKKLESSGSLKTSKQLHYAKLEYKKIRGIKGVKETKIKLNGKTIRCLVINDLNNAKKMLKKAKKYHFIEIMACKGGCIGGVGQPLPMTDEKLKQRIQALYTSDKHKKIRRSHNNPAVKKIYKELLEKPLSKTSEKLLHTFYYKREF